MGVAFATAGRNNITIKKYFEPLLRHKHSQVSDEAFLRLMVFQIETRPIFALLALQDFYMKTLHKDVFVRQGDELLVRHDRNFPPRIDVELRGCVFVVDPVELARVKSRTRGLNEGAAVSRN